MSSEQKKKDRSVQVAVIGLIGTVLTACGGLVGASISMAATIYSVERSQHSLDISMPVSDQALNIDTQEVFISRQEAAALDPQVYFVDLDHGLAMRRPLNRWGELEEMTLGEQMAEGGAATEGMEALLDQPLYRIRYGEPLQVQFDAQTLIDGQPISQEYLATMEAVYGPPPWTIPYYNAVAVIIYDRAMIEESGIITSLPDMMMATYRFSGGHINYLSAPEGSDVIVMHSTAALDKVRVEGALTSITTEHLFLFAQTDDSYYVVEIIFAPQSGQPMQVWEDMQTYLSGFHFIR